MALAYDPRSTGEKLAHFYPSINAVLQRCAFSTFDRIFAIGPPY